LNVVTLFSGGQDSTTCLHWALAQWPHATHVALSFDYGQRHARELASAARIAALSDVEHRIVKVPINALGANALTDASVPVKEGTDGGLPSTFVPGRNLVFVSLAAGLVGSMGGPGAIVIGASAVDFSGYPDCRPAFVAAAELAVQLALGQSDVHVHAPLIERSKADTVRLARTLGTRCWRAVGISWTCYEGGHRPCGRCPACVLRARGFAEAGERDPDIRS
jgi:7-cyano-7-deazaguanine synthase